MLRSILALLCCVLVAPLGSGCEEEKVKGGFVAPQSSGGGSSPSARPRRRGKGKKPTHEGGRELDWRTVRTPLEEGTDPVAPEPNEKAVWAEATVADPLGFAGLISPVLTNTTLTRAVFGGLLKKAYNLDVSEGILWEKPIHVLWVEPLPSIPTIVASIRAPDDVTMHLPEDVEAVRDRAGNDYSLAFSLTQTVYINFIERSHVILSPHRADYPLLKTRIETLTSEQPGHFVSFSTASVDDTDELTRLIQLLGAQNPVYDAIWSGIESFGVAMIPLSHDVSLTLDRDGGVIHLNLTVSPPAEVPEDAAESNAFLALVGAGDSPSMLDLLNTLPVENATALLARNASSVPDESRRLLDAARVQDTFALFSALDFPRPDALKVAETDRAKALADPIVQLVTRDDAGRDHLVIRASLYDPAAWLKASKQRDAALLALEAEAAPDVTPLDPAPTFELKDALAPEHLTALAFNPRGRRKRGQDANTLIEVVRGEDLFIIFGPEPLPILTQLLSGHRFEQAQAWLDASESRHSGSLLLGHLPVSDEDHFDASLRVHDGALQFDISVPESSLPALLKPVP